MTLDKLTEPYLYGDDQADPVAEPPTLAELQAIGADKLAIQLAAVVGP